MISKCADLSRLQAVWVHMYSVGAQHHLPYTVARAATVISDGSGRARGYMMSSLEAFPHPTSFFLGLHWYFPNFFVSVDLFKKIKVLSRILTSKAD